MRFEATELFARGVTPPQIARRIRVPLTSTYARHARWREGGLQTLRLKGASGWPSRMTPHWRAWLAAELDKGPAAHGWVKDQRWTLTRVATVIARRFQVHFSPAQTWRILHQMGFTVRVPMRGAAERDEEVTTWMREPWPRVERR
ncbi:hypothetical protein GCM10011578_087530 [Streptomyces fuscichromogenes]|uniref:Winged helix-turn helix domain-containing protein n=1 Tax=Streptomyces fuscichromogenes TaxID=1324013 RepID=A0A917XN56_9ACTN|nr:winged helix-turn-helix domain-containing protein [Streptomyces fuscichromogenes]GGN40248.1 hypothetical protein GCM10011578_087530 [Streptomyces fuscichromogenes]